MTDDLKERLRPPGRSVVSKCSDVDGKDLSNAPLTYERIWLQAGDAEVTWCQHSQDDEDVPYVRADFYAASLARITDLEARLAAAEADRDKAREYAAQARIMENKAEVARVSAEVRALRAEAGEDALAEAAKPFADAPAHGMWGGPMVEAILTYEDGSDENSARHKGRISPAKFKAIRAALAAYEARRKG